MVSKNIDYGFWIARREEAFFAKENHAISSAVNKGDTTITVSNGNAFSAGDQAEARLVADSTLYASRGEVLNIVGVNGDILKLKNGLDRNYGTSDTVTRYWVDNMNEYSDVVKIHTSDIKRSGQAKYEENYDKIDSGQFGKKTSQYKVKGDLKVKEQFTITGRINTGYIPAVDKENSLMNMLNKPFVEFKYRFGPRYRGIIDKINITETEEVLNKDRHSSSDFRPESKKTKLKITRAIPA